MDATTKTLLGVLAAVVAVVAATAAATESDADSECTADAPVNWSPPRDTTPDLRLVLNVPAYRLDVVERGRVTRSISVAVGQPKYPTPIGHYRVDYAVWNPWWHPPPDAAWARKERVTPPGWANPVGRVKLHVTGLVFLHGTPLEDSRGSAASHACVRMSNADAIALARLVHDRAGPALPAALLDSLVADTSWTRTIGLSLAVPIDVDYRLVEVRDSTLALYRDIYRREDRAAMAGRVADALLRAGIDTQGLDEDRLRALIRKARRGAALLPLDSLFSAAAP
jgi:murein L,D-transpeptidase YcbB/YkuD